MKRKLRMSPYRRAREELLSGRDATRIQAMADLEAAIRADQKRIDAEQPADAFPLPIRPDGTHHYLGTGCLHGDELMPDGRTGHAYCQGATGLVGAKTPGRCKVCAAPCACPCHGEQAAVAGPATGGRLSAIVPDIPLTSRNTVVSAFRVIVEPDVVHDQIAAEPETLALLVQRLQAMQGPEPSWLPELHTPLYGLSIAPDPDLPPGEVHLRRASPTPYTQAQQTEELRRMADWYARMMPSDTEEPR